MVHGVREKGGRVWLRDEGGEVRVWLRDEGGEVRYEEGGVKD